MGIPLPDDAEAAAAAGPCSLSLGVGLTGGRVGRSRALEALPCLYQVQAFRSFSQRPDTAD